MKSVKEEDWNSIFKIYENMQIGIIGILKLIFIPLELILGFFGGLLSMIFGNIIITIITFPLQLFYFLVSGLISMIIMIFITPFLLLSVIFEK